MNNLDAIQILRAFYDYDINDNIIRLGDYDSWWEYVHIKKTSDIIILDTPDYFEWKALCKIDGGYGLRLEPGYKVLLS